MANIVKNILVIASMLVIAPHAYGMGKARGQKPTVKLSEAPPLKSKKSLVAAGSVAPAPTKGTLTANEMLTKYGAIFTDADLFGKPINFVNWNAAAKKVLADAEHNQERTEVITQILKYNDQLIKAIQNAFAQKGKYQKEDVLTRWQNDFKSIAVLVTANNPTGPAKKLAEIIKNAAENASAQISKFKARYWKQNPPARTEVTAPTRSRAQAGVAAQPPRPISQAMTKKQLPVPPTKAKTVKK